MSSSIGDQESIERTILAAARRLLERDGEAAVTMDRIATESGISRATIYRRFGTRSSLLQHLAGDGGTAISSLDRDGDLPSRIVKAALALVNTTGSLSITMEQVAAEAGVGVATVYRHFGNKDQLLRSLAEHAPVRQAARGLVARPSADIAADLAPFAQRAAEFLQTQRGLARVFFSNEQQDREILRPLQADQERSIHTLARYFEVQIASGLLQEADPFDLAAGLMGLLIGLALVKPMYGGANDNPAAVAEFAVGLFLQGTRKGKGP